MSIAEVVVRHDFVENSTIQVQALPLAAGGSRDICRVLLLSLHHPLLAPYDMPLLFMFLSASCCHPVMRKRDSNALSSPWCRGVGVTGCVTVSLQ